MSPIAGFTRFRKHQVGKQSALLTAVAATRILPYRGAIVVNPNREDPDVDVGSLDPILAPFSGAKEVSANWAGKAAYDDLPYIYALGLKGGVTPSTNVWTYALASLTADSFDYITDEWGDDTSASDGIRAYGGVIDSFTLGFDENLGAFDVSADLVYADADLATDRTAALTLDETPNWVYGADTVLYLDTTAGAIGTTAVVDALHGAQLSVQNNLDRKRFANGSNTRFKLAGYGRGARVIELQVTLAKTTATMAEAATLDDDPVPNRYLEVLTVSPEIVTGSTVYRNSWRMPGRLVSREDGEIGGNSTIILTYRAFYSSTLTYAFRAAVTNGLSAL